MKNVSYCYFNDRYSSSWTLRLKGIYTSSRAASILLQEHHFYMKQITDLDILGLYHEIEWKIK